MSSPWSISRCAQGRIRCCADADAEKSGRLRPIRFCAGLCVSRRVRSGARMARSRVCAKGRLPQEGSSQIRVAERLAAVLRSLGRCGAVALAASGGFPAYLRITWEDFVDCSANGCCAGEMVQFVAPFLASTATPIRLSREALSSSVAFVGG